MKIAVFNRIFSAQGGGAERYSVTLVEQLAARHEIHVFAQDFGKVPHNFPNVTYHRVSAPLKWSRWLNQLWYATATWWLTRKGGRNGFDVVHSHENTWHGDVQTVHVLPIKHNLFNDKTGWRRAATWLNVLTSPRLLAYLALERGRFASKLNRHIVLTSPSLLAIFKATYPDCGNVINVITPGVAKVDFSFDKGAAKQALGLPAQGWTIAFVGNDYEKKGLPTLLQALKALPAHVNLVAVGNQVDMAVYQKLANQLGLEPRVRFLGAVADVSQVYKAADVLAHPTLEDTFAMVVLEALSYGLPVVVSQAKYCGISGLLTHGQNALILDNPKDVAELTAALEKLMYDSKLRERLSQNARQFADDFGWDEIAKQQETVYFDAKSKI